MYRASNLVVLPPILVLIALSLSYIRLVHSGEDFNNFVKPDPVPTHFAIDVDDTFYVSDPAVFKRNVEAFKWLRDNNILAFFCTGRNPQSNRKLLGDDFFTETGYNGYPGVYANGALVYDSDGKVIKMSRLSVDYLERVNRCITDSQLPEAIFHADDGTYVLQELSDLVKGVVKSKKVADPEKVSFDVLKGKNVISMFLYNFQLSDDLKENVYHVEYERQGYTLFQISPLNCNKKSGLEALLNKLQVDVKSCAFIGDNNNDVEVMEHCPISFAVGNATDRSKEKAKWALSTKYDEGAFEEVVKKMYGNDWNGT